MRLLAVTLALALVPVAGAEAKPYWQGQGCARPFAAREAHRGIAKILRNHSPLTRAEGKRVWRLSQCANGRRRAKLNIRYADKLRAWRRAYPNRWPIRFNRLPASDRAWAVSTSTCEAHMNPATNTGNGFEGAFQFMYSTWLSAGGTGHAYQHSWHYQAVIAIAWMHRAGPGQWPVCGH